MKRQCAAIVAIAVILSAGAAPARAASQICEQLETRLAALATDSRGDRRIAQRYAQAIEVQQRQIDKVQQQRRRAGCGGSIVRTRQESGSACGSLDRTLERMRRNLAKLHREHNALAGGSLDGQRERRRLLASIEANECRNDRRDGTSLVRQAPGIYRVSPPALQEDGQRYRTMCVRTCDGYYFPISYDVPSAAFENDAASCASRCPGTEAELYVHRVPGENAEDMISRAGTLYKELPTAFLYRQPGFERPPQCGCSPAPQSSIIDGDAGDGSKAAASPNAAAPEGQSSLVQRDVEEQSGGTAERTPDSPHDGRKVRVVGPAFLPDPEGAIDLRAPAQTDAP